MRTAMNLLEALHGAQFVQIDDELFETAYLRLPDDDTAADDILLEAKAGETELSFTRDELDDAQYIGEGLYQLKSGVRLRFFSPTTIH